MWFFGIFGSYPNKVGTLLKYYGINYSKVSLEQLNNPGIYIVSYWAEWQLHNMLSWAYDGAKDVDLEYVRDSRWYVEVFSGILKGFGYI